MGKEIRTKPKSSINWKDYVVFLLLFLPLIWAVGWWEFLDIVGFILVFVVFGSPPIIYLDSRRLGGSRKSAIGWALGSFLLWIVITPTYILSKRKQLKKRLQEE